MVDKIVKILSKLFSIKTFIILGALLLMVSSSLGWIDQPIIGWLKGNNIRLSRNLPPVISYGLICLTMGLFSFLALFSRLRWMSFLTGIISLILSLHFFLTFCFFDSKKIIAINDLNQQEKHISSFHKFLPPNLGIEPTFDMSVQENTIRDRFYATLHFATLGWYASILGSLLLLIVFAKSRINKNIKIISFFLFSSLILLYLSVTLPFYIAAEYHINKGEYYLANGMYMKAIDEYEIARQLDPNMDYLKSFHNNIGKAYFFIGRSDKADYYIYRADICVLGKTSPSTSPLAIFYFNTAKIMEPSISNTVGNSYISWAYVNYGLFKYRKRIVSSAIELWKKSLEVDPSQIQAYYYLSRAYYDIGSYEESIMMGIQFMKLSKNKIMKANVSSNIADSFYRLKNYNSARAYYIKSLLLDKYGNLRAIMSVLGK